MYFLPWTTMLPIDLTSNYVYRGTHGVIAIRLPNRLNLPSDERPEPVIMLLPGRAATWFWL